MNFKTSILLFFLIYLPLTSSLATNNKDLRHEFNKGFSIGTEKADSIISFFNSIRTQALESEDTLLAVRCLHQMAIKNLNLFNHSEALNLLTEALFLSEEYHYKLEKSEILSALATIHERYGQDSVSQDYTLQSIILKKELYNDGIIDEDKLIKAYRDFSILAQNKKDYNKALTYLDTCYMLSAKTKRSAEKEAYLSISKAKILSHQNKVEEALAILYPLELFFDSLISTSTHLSPNTSMQSFVLSYIGDILYDKGKVNEAYHYYSRSYDNLIKHKLHHATQMTLLDKLAEIDAKQGNYKKAYLKKIESNTINNKYFTTGKERNSSVISVNDLYKRRLERQEAQIMKQKLELAKKEKAIFRFQTLVGIILLIVILGALLVRNKVQKIHYEKIRRLEKEKAEQLKEHTEQQLRNKNKELTSYTLQLIERDDLLDKFSSYIKENHNDTAGKSLILARKQLNANNWEEFNKRFVSVNRGFYERLSKKYPELTPTDQKHCALIKLNFSGKEMANLLGISEKSVHMARYRIRKKMQLNTEVNLSNFITNI